VVCKVDRLIDVAQLEGWIPARVSWQEGKPLVDWCYLGEHGFSESFFDQTLNRCIQLPFNLLFRQQTSMEVLGQLYEAQPGLRPKGFIFHLSRSGSTLVSQMLAALRTNIVLSEVRPIDSLLRGYCFELSVSDDQRIEWVRWMVNSLAQVRRGDERHLFIKFDAWSIFELPVVRRAFPDVPWIFVYRDPLEVLVSHMAQRGAHMVPGVINPQIFGMDQDAITEMAPEEYCAKVLRSICEAVLRLQDEGVLLVNYSQLPDATVSSISRFFDVSWTDSEVEAMASVTTHHSKNSATEFHRHSAEKRTRSSPRLFEAAKRWVYPAYEAIEKARLANQRP